MPSAQNRGIVVGDALAHEPPEVAAAAVVTAIDQVHDDIEGSAVTDQPTTADAATEGIRNEGAPFSPDAKPRTCAAAGGKQPSPIPPPIDTALARGRVAGDEQVPGHEQRAAGSPASVLKAEAIRRGAIMFPGARGAVVASLGGKATSELSYGFVSDVTFAIEQLHGG